MCSDSCRYPGDKISNWWEGMEKRIKLCFGFYSIYKLSYSIDIHKSIFIKAKRSLKKKTQNGMQYCKASDAVSVSA